MARDSYDDDRVVVIEKDGGNGIGMLLLAWRSARGRRCCLPLPAAKKPASGLPVKPAGPVVASKT